MSSRATGACRRRRARTSPPDGYFITGDVGTIDADGRVTIVGRAKDLIISGGFNVYPKEIEEVLDALPGVGESAVIGVPHPDFGEGVVAVVTAQGTLAAGGGDHRRACRQRCAKFKVPKRIFVVAELPRNAMGKVQKAELRKALRGRPSPAEAPLQMTSTGCSSIRMALLPEVARQAVAIGGPPVALDFGESTSKITTSSACMSPPSRHKPLAGDSRCAVTPPNRPESSEETSASMCAGKAAPVLSCRGR